MKIFEAKFYLSNVVVAESFNGKIIGEQKREIGTAINANDVLIELQ